VSSYVHGDRLGVSAGTTALVSTGANVIVPGSGPIVAVGISVLNSLFSGNQDAARLAREQWFEQAAKQRSPTAARVMIGGTTNTASHEIPFYQAGIQRLLADPSSAPTMQAALAVGGYWDSTDNATSDKMRALIENELEQLATTIPTTPSGPVPGAAGGRAQQLPPVVTRAPFNWTPYLLAGAAGVVALFVVPRIIAPSRRR
jgi:hypothetical protein